MFALRCRVEEVGCVPPLVRGRTRPGSGRLGPRSNGKQVASGTALHKKCSVYVCPCLAAACCRIISCFVDPLQHLVRMVVVIWFIAAALAPSYGYVLPSGRVVRRLPSQQTIRLPPRIDYGQTRDHSLIWPLRSPDPQCCLVQAAAADSTAGYHTVCAFSCLPHLSEHPLCGMRDATPEAARSVPYRDL